jgi:hypothetical protein
MRTSNVTFYSITAAEGDKYAIYMSTLGMLTEEVLKLN